MEVKEGIRRGIRKNTTDQGQQLDGQDREIQTPPTEAAEDLTTTSLHPGNTTMDPVAETATASAAFDRETFHRRALRVTPRGVSSHFVGSSIVILSSFAVSTLAMNCGKRNQDSKNKPNMN